MYTKLCTYYLSNYLKTIVLNLERNGMSVANSVPARFFQNGHCSGSKTGFASAKRLVFGAYRCQKVCCCCTQKSAKTKGEKMRKFVCR